MDFFDIPGYVTYGLSTVCAFLTALMIGLIYLLAAAFAGASTRESVILYVVTGCCSFSYLAPLLLITLRKMLVSAIAIAGSGLIVMLSAWMLLLIARNGQGEPILFKHLAIPIWVWFSCPLFFNALQLTLSISKFNQLRTSR
jgi:hypothetical protein